MSHIRGPRMNYRLKYWLSTGRLSVRAFFVRIEVSWGQRKARVRPPKLPILELAFEPTTQLTAALGDIRSAREVATCEGPAVARTLHW